MYKLKIRKIGNSAGVTLPKNILSALKVKEGDELILTETPDGFAITVFDAAFEEQMQAYEEGARKYRNALRELAK
jgi:putative addiction module antidote